MKASFTSVTLPAPLPALAASAPVPTALPVWSDPFDEMTARQPAPAAAVGAGIKEEPTTLDQLRRFAAGGYLFALMDATDQILVPYQAKQLGPTKAISLFSGTAKEQYWQVAPYLFQVDATVLDWIIAEVWKEPWGIFAITKAKFEDLRVHLKKFLLAQLPDGNVWFFRYYDPRILRTYLPLCDLIELSRFYGPIRAFAMASADVNEVTMVQAPRMSAAAELVARSNGPFWKIRIEQQREFKKKAEENFIDLTMKFLREKLPDQVSPLPPQVFRNRVTSGIARARSYDITWQSSILTFVTLMFEIAPNFDDHPYISKLLKDDRVLPNFRPKELLSRVSTRTWNEARVSANPATWDRVKGCPPYV